MVKIHFFDYRAVEWQRGFERVPEAAVECDGNPLLVSDHPADGGRMSMYGSVIRRPDDHLWQMWYTSGGARGEPLTLSYAESDDGVDWRRPSLPDGPRPGTHIVFDRGPHGACVLCDEAETRPGWRYKMLAGAAPSHRISAFRSPDGVHWVDAAENPIIGINPDCPMSIHRAADGRYVLYCRPQFGDRRVSRRESWDFVHWTEPRIVIDQEPADPPQTQFYGLGAVPYGPYEIGSLWVYHTLEEDLGFNKMRGHQQPELAYSRSGYAWHRLEVGFPLISLGEPGSWKAGNIQPASAPVFLEDEIRFYYAAARMEHGNMSGFAGPEPGWGLGFVSLRPDRFVGMHAREEGRLLTRPIWVERDAFHVNAAVSPGGAVRVELRAVDGTPVPGFGLADCRPITGDRLDHVVRWEGDPDRSSLPYTELRLLVEARNATVYALGAGTVSEWRDYRAFRLPDFITAEQRRAHGMWPD